MTEGLSCFVDTNVWIELFNDDAADHKKAEAIFNNFERQSAELYICPLILSECLHTGLKICKLKRITQVEQELEEVVRRIFQAPTLRVVAEPIEMHAFLQITRLLSSFRIGSNDGMILYLTLHHRIKSLCTFDKQLSKAAKKLGIQVINQ